MAGSIWEGVGIGVGLCFFLFGLFVLWRVYVVLCEERADIVAWICVVAIVVALSVAGRMML